MPRISMDFPVVFIRFTVSHSRGYNVCCINQKLTEPRRKSFSDVPSHYCSQRGFKLPYTAEVYYSLCIPKGFPSALTVNLSMNIKLKVVL